MENEEFPNTRRRRTNSTIPSTSAVSTEVLPTAATVSEATTSNILTQYNNLPLRQRRLLEVQVETQKKFTTKKHNVKLLEVKKEQLNELKKIRRLEDKNVELKKKKIGNSRKKK